MHRKHCINYTEIDRRTEWLMDERIYLRLETDRQTHIHTDIQTCTQTNGRTDGQEEANDVVIFPSVVYAYLMQTLTH